MTLEALLRISSLQAELKSIAAGLDPREAKIVRYSVSILDLLRAPAPGEDVTGPLKLVSGTST